MKLKQAFMAGLLTICLFIAGTTTVMAASFLLPDQVQPLLASQAASDQMADFTPNMNLPLVFTTESKQESDVLVATSSSVLEAENVPTNDTLPEGQTLFNTANSYLHSYGGLRRARYLQTPEDILDEFYVDNQAPKEVSYTTTKETLPLPSI